MLFSFFSPDLKNESFLKFVAFFLLPILTLASEESYRLKVHGSQSTNTALILKEVQQQGWGDQSRISGSAFGKCNFDFWLAATCKSQFAKISFLLFHVTCASRHDICH